MERTGGEPDVVGQDATTGEYLFYDYAAESPKGRRSVCYDQQALEKQEKNTNRRPVQPKWLPKWALTY
jgi:hypothetical protein